MKLDAVDVARMVLVGIQPDWSTVDPGVERDALAGLAFVARRLERDGRRVNVAAAVAILTPSAAEGQ